MSTHEIHAVMLAGSHVWRREGLDAVCPRSLLPLVDAPLLSHQLRWLARGGVDAATVCTNHSVGLYVARRAWWSECGVAVTFYEDRAPRGPAGSARDVAELVGAQTLVVVEGSVVPAFPLGDAIARHRETGAALTVIEHRAPGGQGVPGGVYLVEHRALEKHVGATGYHDIKESLLPVLYRAAQPVLANSVGGSPLRVRDLNSYLAAQRALLLEAARDTAGRPDYRVEAGSLRHQSAVIGANVRIVPPVLIGPGCQIGDDVVLAGPAILGPGTLVAERSAVVRSVLWNGCRVPQDVSLDECVLLGDADLAIGARWQRVALWSQN